MRLRRALDEFIVEGIETTLPLFRALVRNSDVQNGQYDIHWLEDFLRNEPEARLSGTCELVNRNISRRIRRIWRQIRLGKGARYGD